MNPLITTQSTERQIPEQLTDLIEAGKISLKNGKKDIVWFEYGPYKAAAKCFQDELESIKFINRDLPDGQSNELLVFIQNGKATEFKLTKKGLKYSRDNGIQRGNARRSVWIFPELQMTFDGDGKVKYLGTELCQDIEAHIKLYLKGELLANGQQQGAFNSFGFFAFDESERIQKVSGGIPDMTGERVSMDYSSDSHNEYEGKTDIAVRTKMPILKYYIFIGLQTITVYVNGDMVDSFYLTPTLPEDIQALFGIKNTSQLIEVVGERVNDLNK